MTVLHAYIIQDNRLLSLVIHSLKVTIKEEKKTREVGNPCKHATNIILSIHSIDIACSHIRPSKE